MPSSCCTHTHGYDGGALALVYHLPPRGCLMRLGEQGVRALSPPTPFSNTPSRPALHPLPLRSDGCPPHLQRGGGGVVIEGGGSTATFTSCQIYSNTAEVRAARSTLVCDASVTLERFELTPRLACAFLLLHTHTRL